MKMVFYKVLSERAGMQWHGGVRALLIRSAKFFSPQRARRTRRKQRIRLSFFLLPLGDEGRISGDAGACGTERGGECGEQERDREPGEGVADELEQRRAGGGGDGGGDGDEGGGVAAAFGEDAAAVVGD